jgi:hypothetical protein
LISIRQDPFYGIGTSKRHPGLVVDVGDRTLGRLSTDKQSVYQTRRPRTGRRRPRAERRRPRGTAVSVPGPEIDVPGPEVGVPGPEVDVPGPEFDVVPDEKP